MVEELLRGDCMPLLSRLLASCTPGTPSAFKATADGTSLLFDTVYFMLVVGMSQPHTRGLVLSPQLPALIELWARAAAIEAPPAPHGKQESSSHSGNSVLSLVRQADDGTPQSFARSVRRSLCKVTLPLLLRHRSEGGEPLRAVLSGPCLQYLVALKTVSQLHAADGGTLYGLPPAAVLPLELARVEGRLSGGAGRRQGQAALSGEGLTDCVDFWESCITGQPRVSLGPLRNRCLVNLCMRLSRVALASLEGAESAAAQPQTGKGSRSQQQQQGQGGAEAGSNASGAPLPASGVASAALRQPLEAGKCAAVALQSLNLAATVLRDPEVNPNQDYVGGMCNSDGGGSAGSHECADAKTSDRSAPSSCSSIDHVSSSNHSSSSSSSRGMQAASPSETEGGGSPGAAADSPADGSPAAPEPSADPRLYGRSFGRRWWPLAVGAVQAAMRQAGGMDCLTFVRCCSVLSLSAGDELSEFNLVLNKLNSLLDRLSQGPACSAAKDVQQARSGRCREAAGYHETYPALSCTVSAPLPSLFGHRGVPLSYS